MTNELFIMLAELRSCGEKLTETADALMNYYSSNKETTDTACESVKEEPKAEPEVKTYTKEDVRALLAQKAKVDGCKYKTTVKSLVAKYSSDGTLTKVPIESYAELMAELEVIGNA